MFQESFSFDPENREDENDQAQETIMQAAWLPDFLETETRDVEIAASIGWLLAVSKERQRRNWKKRLKRRRRLGKLERL